MDAIKYLLGKIVKIVIMIFVVVFVVALIRLIYPGLHFPTMVTFSFLNQDWIPTPKNYNTREAIQPDENGMYGTLFVAGEPFNGYKTAPPNQYVTYSYNGEQVAGSQRAFSSAGTGESERSRYIRNISLYEGASVTYGQTIYGEARSDMFTNGLFQIVISDRMGRPITSMYAMNLGAWSVPGWLRWKAVVPARLPQNIDCTLIFVASDGKRTSLPVLCK